MRRFAFLVIVIVAAMLTTAMVGPAQQQPGNQTSTPSAANATSSPLAATQQPRSSTGAGATGFSALPRASGNVMRADDLIGRDVVGSEGDQVANVDNLVVRASDGCVVYAVLGRGGFLGLGEDLIPVPLSAFQLQNNDLMLNADEQLLDNAPTFGRYEWPSAAELQQDSEIRMFWNELHNGAGISVAGGEAGATSTSTPFATATPTTGAATGAPDAGLGAGCAKQLQTADDTSNEYYLRATQLGRYDLVTQQTQDQRVQLGTVEDLLVDMDASQVLYVLANLTAGAVVTGTPGAGVGAVPAGTETPSEVGTALPGAATTGTAIGAVQTMSTPAVGATTAATSAAGAAGAATPSGTASPIPQVGAQTSATIAASTNVTTATGLTSTGFISPGVPGALPQVASFVPIPWKAMRVDPEERDLVLLAGEDTLSRAPTMNLAQGTSDMTAGWDNAVRSYWASLVSSTAGGQAPGTASQTGTGNGLVVQARDVLDYRVEDAQGNNLADLVDLLVDANSDRVLFGTVSQGTILSLNRRLIAIPWNAFQFQPAEKKFILNATESTLQNAPALTSGLFETQSQDWDSVIRSYWLGGSSGITGTVPLTGTMPITGTTATAAAPQARATSILGSTGAANATGTPASATTGAPRLGTTAATTGTTGTAGTPAAGVGTSTGGIPAIVRVQQIFGYDVQDNQGNGLGDVEDVLFDVDSGDIQYLVIGTGGFLGIGQSYTTVPINTVTLDDQAQTVRLSVDQQTFENAPQLNPDSLPEQAGSAWDTRIRGYWNQVVPSQASPGLGQPTQTATP